MRMLLLAAVLACGRPSTSHYDGEIASAAKAVAAARTDAERAAALSEHGRWLGEKARYSRAFKLVPFPQYAYFYAAAIAQHDKAIALAPTAEAYFARGRTEYWRGTAHDAYEDDEKPWWTSSRDDFSAALQRDPKHALAWDMRGLLLLAREQYEDAIADFTAETKLEAKMQFRVADAHCLRAMAKHRKGDVAGALADYEKAVALGAHSDGCECDARAGLAALKR